jgi:hypothetical protein
MDVPVILFDLVRTEPGQLPETIITYIQPEPLEQLQKVIDDHIKKGMVLLSVPGTTITRAKRSALVNDQSSIPAEGTAHAKSNGYIIDDAKVDDALVEQQTKP